MRRGSVEREQMASNALHEAHKLTEDALTAIRSDDPRPPVVFPVPEEHREAAAAWAAMYCLATSLRLRDMGEPSAPELPFPWAALTRSSARTAARDVQRLLSDGTVHQAQFYGLEEVAAA